MPKENYFNNDSDSNGTTSRRILWWALGVTITIIGGMSAVIQAGLVMWALHVQNKLESLDETMLAQVPNIQSNTARIINLENWTENTDAVFTDLRIELREIRDEISGMRADMASLRASVELGQKMNNNKFIGPVDNP